MIPFHQPCYDQFGNFLSNGNDDWAPIRWWCDAWWDVAFPKDCTGLTYLDVGCAEGLYPLRFSQRGGASTGINPSFNHQTAILKTEWRKAGNESQNDTYISLKKRYPNLPWKVLEGGFDIHGKVEPEVGVFDYVSCMNCLEYLPEPRKRVEELFKHASQQVMIATDISFNETVEHTDGKFLPLLRHLSIKDLQSWCQWPAKSFTFVMEHNGTLAPQGLVISRKSGIFSDLPESVQLFSKTKKYPTQQTYERTVRS